MPLSAPKRHNVHTFAQYDEPGLPLEEILSAKAKPCVSPLSFLLLLLAILALMADYTGLLNGKPGFIGLLAATVIGIALYRSAIQPKRF